MGGESGYLKPPQTWAVRPPVIATVLKPPPPALLRACDVLDSVVGSVAAAISKTRADFGRLEAAVEASILLRLLVRHIEGVIVLARTDLVLLPAAMALTRAAFETGVRVRWLLFPEREFDREARWLVHLEEEERLWRRMAELAERTGAEVEAYRRVEAEIRMFRLAVRERLPAGTALPPGIPSVAAELQEQKEERRYITYVLLSQFVHGGHYAGAIWRRGLGTTKEFGEHVTIGEWKMMLQISWWSLYQSATRFIEVACDAGTRLIRREEVVLLEQALGALEGQNKG